jgi:hypothetical protein
MAPEVEEKIAELSAENGQLTPQPERIWNEGEVVMKKIYTLDERNLANVQVRLLDCVADQDLLGICSARLHCGMDIMNIEVRVNTNNPNRNYVKIPYAWGYRVGEDLRHELRTRVSRCYEWLDRDYTAGRR